MDSKKILKKIGFVVLSMAILMAIFLIGPNLLNIKKISYGIKIANFEVGGKSKEEAKLIIEERLKGLEFSIKNGNDTLIGILPQDIGVNVLLDKSLEDAYLYGRNRNPFLNSKDQIFAVIFKKDLELECDFDKEKFESFLKNNFQKFEIIPQDATLIFNEKSVLFEIVPERQGFIIDKEKLLSNVKERIYYANSEPIVVKFKEVLPKIKEAGAMQAKEATEELLKNSPYFISYQDGKRKIDSETIAEWLIFTPTEKNGQTVLETTISENKINDFLTQLLPTLNIPAENAKFTLENGKAAAFSPGYPGRNLKIEESSKKIIEEILKKENTEIELIFEKIEPEITTSSAESLGIITLLGTGTSNFAGSPKNRISNIKIGLSKIQGILIKKDEEFSFNAAIGEIDEKNGFLPELVIKNNKTTPELGGGLCQVSTTLFRAAIYGGLEIIERYPHAFPVSYYSPQGFDATIYPPHPDLRFKNNTPTNILIQGKIKGTVITFELYGTSDGRKVVVTKPEEYDKKEDGSLKARFKRQIWYENNLQKEETFYSNYKSPKLYPVENPATPTPTPTPTPIQTPTQQIN